MHKKYPLLLAWQPTKPIKLFGCLNSGLYFHACAWWMELTKLQRMLEKERKLRATVTVGEDREEKQPSIWLHASGAIGRL